jgi:hypothetical protein
MEGNFHAIAKGDSRSLCPGCAMVDTAGNHNTAVTCSIRGNYPLTHNNVRSGSQQGAIFQDGKAAVYKEPVSVFRVLAYAGRYHMVLGQRLCLSRIVSCIHDLILRIVPVTGLVAMVLFCSLRIGRKLAVQIFQRNSPDTQVLQSPGRITTTVGQKH